MDVATGTKYLPFPQGGLGLLVVVLLVLFSVDGFAAVEDEPMHWSGVKTIWDRKRNKVRLYGNAVVNKPGERLEADAIFLDLNKRTVDAKGNCVYTANDTVIHSDELRFSLDTSAGTIIGGRITNGQFLLVGERINKLGPGKFQTHRGEYTTCHDCPGSWSFQGEDVELEFEGYAYMTNVTGKIKGSPIIWMPYMIVPLKTKRQTGFLFPKFGSSSDHGFRFVQPFFWALGRSADMTLGAGVYTDRGRRVEWQGRYRLTDRSAGQADFFLTRDNKLNEDGTKEIPLSERWALDIQQTQEFPLGIEGKLRFREVSDNKYPIQFSEDIYGRGEPVLPSDIIVSKSTPFFSSFVAARRYRNLLKFDQIDVFDTETVQLFPKAELTSNDHFLFGSPLATGVSLGLSRFTRVDDSFDFDCQADSSGCPTPLGEPTPGTDPIREAIRYTVKPTIYTTLRLFDRLEVVPQATYYGYFYDFQDPRMANLERGYLHTSVDLSFQIEKIYELEDPTIPRVKHTIRPLLRYSYIPYTFEPVHPFIQQIERRQEYRFDNNDIVPLSTSPSLVNYFVPKGNSLTYGMTTQVIRRRGAIGTKNPTYQRSVEVTAGQTLNFLEFEKAESVRVPFSRFFSTLDLAFDKFVSNTQYYFYPYLNRLLPDSDPNDLSPHSLTTSMTYVFEQGYRQNVLFFDRSFSLSYAFSRLDSGRTSSLSGGLNFSLSDYILPSGSVTYDFEAQRLASFTAGLILQNPCWQFSTTFTETIDKGFDFTFSFQLNLTGGGFGGFGELVEQAQTAE